MRCTSVTDCWAVGVYAKKGADLGQALHWTGKKWFLVATPTPGGTLKDGLNDLIDVACTSADSCWAVGSYGNLGGLTAVILNLALHWNGKAWSQVTVPDPGGTGKGLVTTLASVRCTSPDVCWAAGSAGKIAGSIVFSNEMLRWNGKSKKWSSVTVPNPAGVAKGDVNELSGLSCTAPANCWAAGTYGKFGKRTLNLALHWNGMSWSKVRTPNPDGSGAGASNSLVGVSCTSSKDCWAVGGIGDTGVDPLIENEALHWNGMSWTRALLPQPGGMAGGDLSDLTGVRCTDPANCWAVGEQQKKNGPSLDQILHWHGGKWVVS